MKPRDELFQKLDEHIRSLPVTDTTDITWDDAKAIRGFALRQARGDGSAWPEFLDYLRSRRDLPWAIFRTLERLGWVKTTIDHDAGDLSYCLAYPMLLDSDRSDLMRILTGPRQILDESPKSDKPSKVMYIEEKPGLAGHACIGRVTFSGTRKTLYYKGRRLQSLKGWGYKANYFDLETGLHFWVSNCKQDGNDTLYPGTIEIDEDAREEYWLRIRKQPENIHVTQIRSAGKH